MTSPTQPPLQTLFICGCPRSGTTAMWEMLAQHPQILLGMERYFRRFTPAKFKSTLFGIRRFFTFLTGDTFYDPKTYTIYPMSDSPTVADHFGTMRARASQAQIIGDKNPYYYQDFGLLAKVFPDAKVVFVVRNILDVANSYQQRARKQDPFWTADRDFRLAVREWNAALSALDRARAENLFGDRLLVVTYEDFFHDPRHIDTLFGFLGLEADAAYRASAAAIIARAQSLDQDRRYALNAYMLREILLTADIPAYRSILHSEVSILR